MSRKEEQISLMKHLYSMEKQRKKYQAKIDDLKYELEKVEKSKLKKEIKELQEELKNEKAEKEVFKIEAKAYKEENAEIKDRLNKAIKFISNYWQDEKEIDNNKLKDDTSYRTLADKTIILIEKSLKGE